VWRVKHSCEYVSWSKIGINRDEDKDKVFVNLNLEVQDGSLEVWLWQSKTVAFCYDRHDHYEQFRQQCRHPLTIFRHKTCKVYR
jgi:hypothetical protein